MEIPYGHRAKILKKIKNSNRFALKNSADEKDVYNEIGTDDKTRNDFDDLEQNEREQRRLFQLAVEEFRKGNSSKNINYDQENPTDSIQNSNVYIVYLIMSSYNLMNRAIYTLVKTQLSIPILACFFHKLAMTILILIIFVCSKIKEMKYNPRIQMRIYRLKISCL